MIVRGAVPSRGRAARRIAADALLHSSRRTDGPPDRVADMRSANWSSSRFLPALPPLDGTHSEIAPQTNSIVPCNPAVVPHFVHSFKTSPYPFYSFSRVEYAYRIFTIVFVFSALTFEYRATQSSSPSSFSVVCQVARLPPGADIHAWSMRAQPRVRSFGP